MNTNRIGLAGKSVGLASKSGTESLSRNVSRDSDLGPEIDSKLSLMLEESFFSALPDQWDGNLSTVDDRKLNVRNLTYAKIRTDVSSDFNTKLDSFLIFYKIQILALFNIIQSKVKSPV